MQRTLIVDDTTFTVGLVLNHGVWGLDLKNYTCLLIANTGMLDQKNG